MRKMDAKWDETCHAVCCDHLDPSCRQARLHCFSTIFMALTHPPSTYTELKVRDWRHDPHMLVYYPPIDLVDTLSTHILHDSRKSLANDTTSIGAGPRYLMNRIRWNRVDREIPLHIGWNRVGMNRPTHHRHCYIRLHMPTLTRHLKPHWILLPHRHHCLKPRLKEVCCQY
jgi:hypothetical protein